MTERTPADFLPGTRVVRTAVRNVCVLDVLAGTRGSVYRTMDNGAVKVAFDDGTALWWGGWEQSGKWLLACIAPICTMWAGTIADGQVVECGLERPCAVHDAPAAPTSTSTPRPEDCGCETCMAPPRRLYQRERIAAGEPVGKMVEKAPCHSMLAGATPAWKPCRWCRGPCRRPVTHGEV